ncbi:glyoxylate reductase [Aspergillus steynii IBT 23096]|uniref:Glyoxylate reductase n=1 Tax=Aspergillus steynii IBT 23096 TaxID=1392250 RepID=A0A2I2GHZ2_9EURO|nr:glyoxylate reductase [Aspergillus steynii IBT 23096]PLB52499.1 glyoxylate reductase [Aspergillus steynii IBT 23096]
MNTKPTTKPTILLLRSPVSHNDPATTTHLNTLFNILEYDCPTIADFISALSPGGKYSNISAIVRTGWLKAGPYASHLLFQGEPITHYPPSLKLICCSGHGFDAADIPRLTQRGILYCNTPDTCTVPVANVAVQLVLNTFRYLSFAEHCVRSEQWMKSRELGLKAVDPEGMVLGVVGMGCIGREIARRAKGGLGMRIHYFNRRRVEDLKSGMEDAMYEESLEALIRVSDCLVLACPYTTEMHHMLSRREFALAKEGGLRVVNIARGKLVDEEALLEAMDEGKVVGVGLDVHEHEPQVNPRLLADPMVTVLPHIGVCSQTTWKEFDRVSFENLEEFFYGSGVPKSAVNVVE